MLHLTMTWVFPPASKHIIMNEFPICGRLTKSKKPCQNPPTFYTACRTHATEQDKAIDKWGWDMWSKGFETGNKSGRESALSEIKQAECRAKAQAEEERNFKLRTSSGCQIIQCGKYSYVVPQNIPDVKVGDTVTLPSNWLVNYSTNAEVTGLGSSYTGDLSSIVGVVLAAK